MSVQRLRRLRGLSSVMQHQVAQLAAQVGALFGQGRTALAACGSRSRISSMRRDISRSWRTIGCTRRVRRLSSSTSVSALRRLRQKRLRAAIASSDSVRRLISCLKSARLLLEQVLERRQVVRHAGHDLLFGQPLGERDLDRAVEGQGAAMHFGQRADRGRQREIAAEHGAAEALAGDFDLFGQRDFLSRVSSGISAICVRYIRTGSSLSLGRSRAGRGAEGDRLRRPSSSRAGHSTDWAARRRRPPRELR